MNHRALATGLGIAAAALLSACSATQATSTAPVAATQPTPPDPAATIVIAEFEGVLSHTGEPRRKDALLGHPTVVWFFPMAGTPG